MIQISRSSLMSQEKLANTFLAVLCAIGGKCALTAEFVQNLPYNLYIEETQVIDSLGKIIRVDFIVRQGVDPKTAN